jgi:glycosyltransferase involved in cell wall biosynthesis
MNILLLSQFFPPIVGGEERHVYNLACNLARRHTVTVVTLGKRTETTAHDDFKVHSIRPATASLPFLYGSSERQYSPPVPDPKVLAALRRILINVSPDIVHAHNWIVNSLVPLRRVSSAPFLLTLHDYSHVCATKRMMYMGSTPCPGPAVARCTTCAWHHYKGPVGTITLAGNTLGRSGRVATIDKFLAVSTSVAESNLLAARGLTHEVPDDLFESRENEAPFGLNTDGYLIFVGDVGRDKGVDTLLRAYSRLPDDRPPLLIIGRRDPNFLDEIPRAVKVLPPQPHPQVMQAIESSAFAVLPSAWPDPCPTTVLEAMAKGRAVATTPMGGIRDMVQHGFQGLVVPPGDSEALAGALMRLIRSPELRGQLGAAARSKAREFSASQVVPRIEAIYEETIASRSQ